jgi:hypothetical protein
MIDVVTIIACGVGLLGCVVFGVLYHVKSRGGWWTEPSRIGRTFMMMNAVLASILALIMTTRLFGDWPGRRAVVLGLVIIYMLKPWWWVWVLLARAYTKQEPNRLRKGE